MARQFSPLDDEKQPIIRWGMPDSVDIYVVKEGELDVLEKGSAANIDLSFAIFLFSSVFTSIAALVTSGFKSEKVELIFIIVSIGAVIAGSYLTFRWWRSRESIKEVAEKIRDRIDRDTSPAPEDPEFQPIDPADTVK